MILGPGTKMKIVSVDASTTPATVKAVVVPQVEARKAAPDVVVAAQPDRRVGTSGLTALTDPANMRLRIVDTDDRKHLPGLHDQRTHGRHSAANRARQAAQELDELRQSLDVARQRAEQRQAAERVAAAAASAASPHGKPTATPTRMTKGQYTKILKDEHVRLQMLDGKTEKEARALARPAASIDELKERNKALRGKLRDAGVDHRTEEQRRTDDAEKNGLLDEVERLAVAGGHDGPAKRAAAAKMTPPQLRKFIQDTKDYQRRRAERARAEKEGAAAEIAWREQQTKLPARDRQVDYIMNLLARRRRNGDGGGFFNGPTDRAGVAKLSQADASAYIDSLTENY